MSAVVYVLLDSADTPIYVGASQDYGRRLAEHQRTPLWAHVASAGVYPQGSWSLALYVERNLIREWSPEFNTQSVEPVQHAVNGLLSPMFRMFAEATS